MKQLLVTSVCLMLMLSNVLAQTGAQQSGVFVPEQLIPGIGLGRVGMEKHPEQVRQRWQNLVDAQKFGILRDPLSLEGMKRVLAPSYVNELKAAAKEKGFSFRYLRAVSYLESYGNQFARSPTGPLGYFQAARKTAEEEMDLQTGGRCGPHAITVEVKKQVRDRRGRVRVKTVKVVPDRIDERCVLAKASRGAAKHLRDMQDKAGSIYGALWCYHSGIGRIVDDGRPRKLLPVFVAAEASGLKTRDIPTLFFAANPITHNPLWHVISSLMSVDYSPTYPPRVEAAAELIDLAEEDGGFEIFEALWRMHQNAEDPAKKVKNRFLVYVRMPQVGEGDFLPILKLAAQKFDGGLDAEYLGVSGLTSGAFQKLDKSAAGLALYIAFETRRLLKVMGSKVVYQPLELISTPGVTQAIHIVPPKDPVARKSLEIVLDDLGTYGGKLGYQKEPAGYISVCPAPVATVFFADIARQVLPMKFTVVSQ